jgi:hypothetical protein
VKDLANQFFHALMMAALPKDSVATWTVEKITRPFPHPRWNVRTHRSFRGRERSQPMIAAHAPRKGFTKPLDFKPFHDFPQLLVRHGGPKVKSRVNLLPFQ